MTGSVFLDESGDLGWKFDKPLSKGGSSRYMTIAFLICPLSKSHAVDKLVEAMYHFKQDDEMEKEYKGRSMSRKAKRKFAIKTLKMLNENPDIELVSVTVNKSQAPYYIKPDGNELYNYMINLGLLKRLKRFRHVKLFRDEKPIKTKSFNSLIDYLQLMLWFKNKVETRIQDYPNDSRDVLGLQFADWLNYVIWSHYEQKDSEAYLILKRKLNEVKLYFKDK